MFLAIRGGEPADTVSPVIGHLPIISSNLTEPFLSGEGLPGKGSKPGHCPQVGAPAPIHASIFMLIPPHSRPFQSRLQLHIDN